MSYFLHGPFPFDPKTVSAGARTALAETGSALRGFLRADGDALFERLWSFFRDCQSGREEGLYVLVKVPDPLARSTTGALLSPEELARTLKAIAHSSRRTPGVVSAPLTESQERFKVQAEQAFVAGEKIEIAGFWVVFGASYLEDGSAGPPDRFPPYAQGLLDAATEEVWWRSLDVTPLEGHTWRPVIVLEWPSYLACRGEIAPPGFARAAELSESDEGAFLSFDLPSMSSPSAPGGGFGTDFSPPASSADLPPTSFESADPFAGFGFDPAPSPQADPPAIEPPVPEPRPVAPAPPEPAAVVPVQAEEDVPWMDLSLERSTVVVVQGEMTYDSNIHHGQFFLISPSAFLHDDPKAALPLHDWLDIASSEDALIAPQGERHTMGHPLELAQSVLNEDGSPSLPRVGFPLSGWYTRGLQVWPMQPILVTPGTLTDRVVQSRWKAQAALALFSTLAVFVLVLSVSISVQFAAEPQPQRSTETPLPAAQPAMSVCSADHQKFVDEFRCQIRAMASAGPEGVPAGAVCGDSGSTEEVSATYDDLQAHFCGLLDREKDDWRGNLVGGDGERFYNYGRLAASQACFNVLGHPHPYSQIRDFSGQARRVGDPSLFLEDPALGIRSLIDLTRELEDACATYETRLEQRVRGAVMATHIGKPLGSTWESEKEPSRLRRQLLDITVNGLADDAERCLRLGDAAGLDAADYRTLCGAPDKGDRRHEKKKIWNKLGGNPALSYTSGATVIERYTEARFGGKPTDKTSNLWQCHQRLESSLEDDRASYVSTLWDLSLPVPVRYSIGGAVAVDSQLQLDAAMIAFDEQGLDAGVCWNVVSKSLSGYSRVHPLLTSLEEGGWPTEEQQLCGQICASYYRLQDSLSAGLWVTQGEDLSRCIYGRDPNRPELLDEEGKTERQLALDQYRRNAFMLGDGQVDQLRLPWNGTRRSGWQEPTLSSVCAYNLIAQDYIPAGDEGYLVGSKPPPLWAGESVQGYGIAGGEDGLAYRSAENLSSYGRSRSTNTCGHAAAQCFTTIVLDITGQRQSKDLTFVYEKYEWFDQWVERVTGLATATPLTINNYSPWCKLISPYMSVDGDLPEGQIDLPCAIGVSEALQNAEAAITFLSAETIQ